MIVVALLWFAPGCGKNKAVFKAYEDARTAAFTDPGPAPARWSPDVRVTVSRPTLDAVITQVLDKRGAFAGTFTKAGASVQPEVLVERLTLGPSSRCDDCMAIDLDFTGSITWSAGPLGQGELPMSGQLAFDAAFDASLADGVWTVRAQPRDVRSVQVRVDGWSGALKNLAEEPLRKWLDEQFVRKIEPIPVTTYGGDDLPLRALDLRATPQGLVVDLLTTMPGGGDVGATTAAPRDGFVAFVAPQTLIALARREMFEAGPQTYDIVPEPTSLSVEGGRFELGLRLWKVAGAGWWRDYTASGRLGAKSDAIELAADEVTEGEKSRGAEVADPLFWLGEGIVQREMQKAINASVPSTQRQRAAGMGAVTRITRIDGADGALRVTGSIEVVARDPIRTKAKTKIKAR